MHSNAASRIALAAAVALLAIGASACGGGSQAPASEPEATSAGVALHGDAASGADVWSSAGCGSCHALAAAGSDGGVGPDLDELKPDFESVVAQVTSGGGGMPSFSDSLSEQEILDVAAYVVESTQG